MDKKRTPTSKNVALIGILASLSIVFGYIEHMIPFDFGIPGIKLGLANIVSVILLYLTSKKICYSAVALRIVICEMIFGSLYHFAFSIVGGLFSLLAMTLAKKIPDTSPIGTSIVGGCAHNIGQIIVAIFVVKNFSIALYLPLLLISGALTGAVIGACSIPVIKRLSKVGF